ncbi:MAG: site-2 protease family protein [Thermoplasmatota archaeon]
MTEVVTKSVAELRTVVERRFQVYDVQFDENVAAFYVNVDPVTLESNFDSLKNDLKSEGLIPVLRYQGAEHSIFIVHRPTRNYRGNVVNIVLFALTWITTTLAGVQWYFNYVHANLDTNAITSSQYLSMEYLDPTNWVMGFLTFAFPLMFILTVHEMGHYVYTKRHGMEASLPFFIPLPFGSPPIGTFGAFISMREPIPNRKALLDIGASGPLAGIIVAIPVLVLGFVLMKLNPVYLHPSQQLTTIGTPLLFTLLQTPFGFGPTQALSPTAFAGWVGLFVTAINLLPAGQLDGGHIAAAMLGERARWLSYATVVVLAILGFGIPGFSYMGVVVPTIPGYAGWLIFAILILFLGAVHPPVLNAVSTLDTRRWVIGAIAAVVIILCFTPVPLSS